MTALITALRAETLKLRHTLAPWMMLLAPAAVVLLVTLDISLHRITHHHLLNANPHTAWRHFGSGMFVLWTFLMLPLYVTLQAAWLGAVDHNHAQWKHLLALPVPRWSHHAAKLLVLMAMVLVSTLVLAALTPLAGLLVMHTQPLYGLAGAAPIGWLAGHALAAFCASGLIIALHHWIALRWHSFTLAIGVGIVATVAGFLIGQSMRYGPFYPWSMPLQVFAGHGQLLPAMVTAGLTGLIVVGAFSLFDLSRREVA